MENANSYLVEAKDASLSGVWTGHARLRSGGVEPVHFRSVQGETSSVDRHSHHQFLPRGSKAQPVVHAVVLQNKIGFFEGGPGILG